jgi:Fic family protein
MIEISQKQQKIIQILLRNRVLSSSDLHAVYQKDNDAVSLVTIKRSLSEMAKIGLLEVNGAGPATVYSVSPVGRLFSAVDAKAYCAEEPDKRYGLAKYNFDLLSSMPPEIFLERELAALDSATAEYKNRTADTSEAHQKREWERLVIELSWKSSKIEGNTYTLLDTERLLKDHKEAAGHDKDEARMIVDHKNAFSFIHQNSPLFKNMTRQNLERLHEILTEGLGVKAGLRQKPVGILGSKYRPLDNIHQITEAVDALSGAIAKARSPYDKALLALSVIGYIQPFDDGNKRTARLMANALLLAHGCAPLSYRSIDENEYRDAVLVFYELNSLEPLKKIFIAQYDFAARNYAAK